jgi:hypothetical protein
MKKRRIIGFLLLIPAFALWFTAIGGASNAHFFADPTDYALMVLGGAVSTIAALVLNIDAF